MEMKKEFENKLEEMLKSGSISQKSPVFDYLLRVLSKMNDLIESSKASDLTNHILKERNSRDFLKSLRETNKKNALPSIDFSKAPLDSSDWHSKDKLEKILFANRGYT